VKGLNEITSEAKIMKYTLTFLLASASVMAGALPNPSTLVEQALAQGRERVVAERYAKSAVPASQVAVAPTREEDYRRIQDDLEKWFPNSSRLEVSKRGSKMPRLIPASQSSENKGR
jgi:hypothetical protein